MNAAVRSALDPPQPRQATQTLDLVIRVGEGIFGLSRVVNVLALLGITPLELAATSEDDDLEIVVRLIDEGPAARLGLARLRALPSVRSARLSPRNNEPTAALERLC